MGHIETLILVAHVVFAAAVIGLVLIQQGKGADVGASFGAGASQTIFGAKGSGSFLTRMTTGLAIAFFITSFALAVFAKQHSKRAEDVGIPVPAAVESPTQDAGAEQVQEKVATPQEQGSADVPADATAPAQSSDTQPELE